MRPHDQAVHDAIVEAIRSGDYPPGARLPAERDWCVRLGVPRTVVRAALARLETEGLVRRALGSGTYVASARGPAAPPEISPAQIMDARFLLEPRLAHLAAVNATAADLGRIEAICAQGEASAGFDAFERADAALHQAIAAATHNSLVVALYAMITEARDQAEWGDLKRRTLTPERCAAYRVEHRRIATALRARNAEEAEAALLQHLQHVRANLLGY